MMKRIPPYFSVILLLTLFSACKQQVGSTISTLKTTPSLPFTATAPVTLQQTSLSGGLFLLYPDIPGVKPIGFSVSLYQEGTLIAKGQIEDIAFYDFENIQPGTYEVWVLIPGWLIGMTDCDDIELPDDQWKWAALINGDERLYLEGVGYKEILDKAFGDYYAVLDGLEIKPGVVNEVDVNLVCKRHT
jgi:hypothetical protein